MGVCGSAPAAPENIIPDPEESAQCTFSVKSAGMMSKDSIVYQGPESEDDNLKWFFMNKTGSMWTSGATIDLENFVRGGNPDKPNQGQVLWSARFFESPFFEKKYKAPSSDMTRFVARFGGPDLDGEEPGDERYFEASLGMNDGGYRRVMKWALHTDCKIAPGTRGANFGDGFVLKVFAKGTAIADYDYIRNEDGEGNYKKQQKEFVDKIIFQLVKCSDNEAVAIWNVKGDLETQGQEVVFKSPLFDCEMRGGWVSTNPLITTGEGWDPTLGLILAYLCAYEYSPNAIKNDLDTKFPDHPFRIPGWEQHEGGSHSREAC